MGHQWNKHVPDANYHAWWGWWFYFRGLDTLTLSHFRKSEQAFHCAADLRRAEFASDDAPLTPEKYANLHELHRLLPLTELAIRSQREGDITKLCHAFIPKAADLQGRDPDPKDPYEVIACRHLGLVYHRCFAPGVIFSPDGQCGTQYGESDYHKHVREKGLEFYNKAIKSGYDEVMSDLGYDARDSRLVPSRNALERSELLSAPGRITGRLRAMAPFSTYALVFFSLASYAFIGVWVFQPEPFFATVSNPVVPQLLTFLLHHRPPFWLLMSLLALYTFVISLARSRPQAQPSLPRKPSA